jgi:hypothetical protein
MSSQQYSANHRGWDHVGNITPSVEYCESIRPHGEWMPADWLPVGRFDKYYEVFKVVSAGKAVALTRDGRLVPAGLKEKFAGGGDVISYTADDVTEKTQDILTGAAVLAADLGATRDAAAVAAALISRGLLATGESASDFISLPVGVAPYDYYQAPGGDGFNPADYRHHNHNMQHRAAILCDYVLELPLVPLAVADEVMDGALGGGGITPGTGAWHTSAGIAASTSLGYDDEVSSGDDVVAYSMENVSVAKNIAGGALSTDASGGLLSEKGSITAVKNGQAGDFFLDEARGVLFLHETDGDAIPAPFSLTAKISYAFYSDVAAAGLGFTFASGDLKPGDLVKADANSNFKKADLALAGTTLANIQAALDERDAILGQVLEVEEFPRDYLDRVRTAYTQLGTLDQMPGSASQGLPDKITYASAANRVVRINLIGK